MNLSTLKAALPNDVDCIQSTVTTEDSPPFVEQPLCDEFEQDFEQEYEEELIPVKYGPQHFELMKLLGEGAFGKVYLVHSRFQKTQYYAMKVLSKRLLKKKNNISYLKVERNVMIKLQQHPFLIHLFAAFQTRKYVYLVMNFLPGGELFLHLHKQGIISERDVQFYLGELILGIEYIHSKGIIHRDIKPENLLLRQDGHICITDFGLAKDISDGKPARTLCGTAEYMAPEMLTRNGYGKGVDFWALGCLTYEMLTSDPPFVVKSSNYKDLEKKILSEKIIYPSFLSANTHSLLKGMLERDTNKRLGCSKSTMFAIGGITALKQHPFFGEMDWTALGELQIPPPIILNIEIPSEIPLELPTTSTKSGNNSTQQDWLKLPYFLEDFTKREISFSMIEETFAPPYEPTASTVMISTTAPHATAVAGTSLPTSMMNQQQECTPNASICTTTTTATGDGEELDEFYEHFDYQQEDSLLTILQTTCHTMGEAHPQYHTPLPSSGSGKFVFHTPRSSIGSNNSNLATAGPAQSSHSQSHSFHATPRAFHGNQLHSSDWEDYAARGSGIPKSLYEQYILDFAAKQQKLAKKKQLRVKQQEKQEIKALEEQAAKALALQIAEEERRVAEEKRIATEKQRKIDAAKAAKAKRKADKLVSKVAFNKRVIEYQDGLSSIQKKLKTVKKKYKDILDLEEKIAIHRAAGTLLFPSSSSSVTKASDAKKGGKEKEKKATPSPVTPATAANCFLLDKDQEKKLGKKGELESEIRELEEEERVWMISNPGSLKCLEDSSDEEDSMTKESLPPATASSVSTVEAVPKENGKEMTLNSSEQSTITVTKSATVPVSSSSSSASITAATPPATTTTVSAASNTGTTSSDGVWKRAIVLPSTNTTAVTNTTTSSGTTVGKPITTTPTTAAPPPPAASAPAAVPAPKKKNADDAWEIIPSKKIVKQTSGGAAANSSGSGKIIPGMKPSSSNKK